MREIKRNQLTHEQVISLHEYLLRHRRQIETDAPSVSDLAGSIATHLGFVCSDSNVRVAAKRAGIDIYTRQSATPAELRQHAVSAMLRRLAQDVYGDDLPDDIGDVLNEV